MGTRCLDNVWQTFVFDCKIDTQLREALTLDVSEVGIYDTTKKDTIVLDQVRK